MWAAVVLVMITVIALRVYRSGPHAAQSSPSA
jgi:hypothetical protein